MATSPADGGGSSATTTRITDGYTPTNVTPGSPAGSYPLSGFADVNLYTGKVNFFLPLTTVGGRGTASLTIGLPISVNFTIDNTFGTSIHCPDQAPCHVYTYNTTFWANGAPSYYPSLSGGGLRSRYAGVDVKCVTPGLCTQ